MRAARPGGPQGRRSGVPGRTPTPPTDSSPPPQSPDDLTPDTEETLTVQGFTWDSDKVTSGLASGIEYEGYACSYAHRNGERRDIPPVADAALGLEPGHGLWIGSADGALGRLRQIAGR
ncbi:hypothetical protein [Streptomyces mirabilis]|uniref:hypothetical protein n=1 Tax=Streptomyces mirabilis TaxID=68239 RepID=UPI0037F1C68D